MEIVEVGEAEVTENPHGVEAKRMYDSENAQAVHILLKPGESLKKHITPVDVFFYILEGNAANPGGRKVKGVCLVYHGSTPGPWPAIFQGFRSFFPSLL